MASQQGIFYALLLVIPLLAAGDLLDEVPDPGVFYSSPPGNPCTAANCTPVFYPGLNRSKCYRIPSIIQSHTGALLAFAEERISSCSDQGAHNMVMRRSLDKGVTWGPLVIVFHGVVPCPGCPAAVSNPNPVEVTFSNGTRAVLFVFDTMNNPHGSQHGLDMSSWSYDDGLTWSKAEPLSFAPETNIGALVGPSTGIQAADGTLFVWITTGFIIVSTDYGATWKPSQRAKVGGECSIAFATDANNKTLIMNCRSGRNHRRSQLYWIASGSTYVATHPTYPAEFTDPGCQGSITNSGPSLYTSNAGSTAGREQMTIHRSDDHGQTWSVGQVLHSGPSAYSQLVSMDGHLGILFEVGVHNPYETISFAAFKWNPPPAPSPTQQTWKHGSDGTLSTDGVHCLDWTSRDGSVYVNICNPGKYPHQRWKFANGDLTSGGADDLTLDWTSRLSPDGGHRVYMHEKSSGLPHQRWTYHGKRLTAEAGDGLCLGWLLSRAVEMQPCASSTNEAAIVV